MHANPRNGCPAVVTAASPAPVNKNGRHASLAASTCSISYLLHKLVVEKRHRQVPQDASHLLFVTTGCILLQGARLRGSNAWRASMWVLLGMVKPASMHLKEGSLTAARRGNHSASMAWLPAAAHLHAYLQHVPDALLRFIKFEAGPGAPAAQQALRVVLGTQVQAALVLQLRMQRARRAVYACYKGWRKHVIHHSSAAAPGRGRVV